MSTPRMISTMTAPAPRPAMTAGPERAVPFGSIHEAALEMCRQHPDLVAVEHLGRTLTYGQLELASRSVAQRLHEAGVRPGDRVGVFLERGVEMVVAILGVLRTGAAYVPQDARIAAPAHLRAMVEIAQIEHVLTMSAFRSRLELVTGGIAVHAVDRWMAEVATDSAEEVAARAQGWDVAAVIFTSGTTGVPNGVQVRHQNLCNTVLLPPADLGIQPGMRVSQLLNIAFDMAAWEILGAITHGATLVVRGSDMQRAADTVDVIIATPSVLSRIDPARCTRLRTAVVAGERCPEDLALTWSRHCTFLNSCGPTEVTIVNTVSRFVPGRPLSIGTPIPNTTVYVLDENGDPVADGEVGEMWAGGDCVTSGYIGNAELTAQRYRPDPFLGAGHLMFRTRDLVRLNAFGEFEHLGRTDDQVKVRGFRVELDAVNNALEAHPGCDRAATFLVADVGLVAYVAPADADIAALRSAVAAAHPYYYVPEHVVALDALPMTDRGKVDRRSLLEDFSRRRSAAQAEAEHVESVA